MDNPLISIIMPLKNNERYFPNAIKSVFDQEYDNWELIIMEGISDDNTGKLADSYANNNSKVKVFHIDERMYESTNLGISKANGDYITVLNSDDKLMPDALRMAAEYIQKYDIDLFFFPVEVIACDETQNYLYDCSSDILNFMPQEIVIIGKENVRRNWTNLFFSGLMQNQLNVYRKSTVKDIRFRNDYYGADYLFNIDVLPKIESIAYYPKFFYEFYMYQTSDKMNASIGKYYDYIFDMYNECYNRTMTVFVNNNCENPTFKKLLRETRIKDFHEEIESYKLDSCYLTPIDKVLLIFKHASYLKDIYAAEGRYDELENEVLNNCYEHISKMESISGISEEMASLLLGIIELVETEDKNKDEVDIKRIYQMVMNYYNPAHVGFTKLKKLI